MCTEIKYFDPGPPNFNHILGYVERGRPNVNPIDVDYVKLSLIQKHFDI